MTRPSVTSPHPAFERVRSAVTEPGVRDATEVSRTGLIGVSIARPASVGERVLHTVRSAKDVGATPRGADGGFVAGGDVVIETEFSAPPMRRRSRSREC